MILASLDMPDDADEYMEWAVEREWEMRVALGEATKEEDDPENTEARELNPGPQGVTFASSSTRLEHTTKARYPASGGSSWIAAPSLDPVAKALPQEPASVASAPRGGLACDDAGMRERRTARWWRVGGPGVLRLRLAHVLFPGRRVW